MNKNLLESTSTDSAMAYGGASIAAPLPDFISPAYWVAATFIGVACSTVALALIYLAARRTDLPWRRLVFLAALLVLSCSMLIFFFAWFGKWPGDRAGLLMNAIVAVLFLVGAVAMWLLAVRAISKPSGKMEQLQSVIARLEHEIAERKRAEEALQKSGESLRQLAAYQEQIKEDERKRIAREIHDELGQNLLALRIDVALLQARTGKSHPLLNEKVSHVLNHIDMSIKAVRAIINNLRPSVLDLGLYAAIEWQVSEFERRTGIACEVITDRTQSEIELDDHRATALFRILQESLTNVARHAQASLVKIEVHGDHKRLIMRIADNGIGLYPGCRRKPNSFGLLGIGERVSSLGGEFQVDGRPGEGTVLTITIPIKDIPSEVRPALMQYSSKENETYRGS